MTVQEAKEILGSGNIITANCRSISITNKARDIAIECMEEVEQYRALGTVEEIKKKIQTELPYMSIAQSRFKSELDEYRNIGTVEELKEAREKQIPKKAKVEQYFYGVYYRCPICDRVLHDNKNHCGDCGQAIDWSEEE